MKYTLKRTILFSLISLAIASCTDKLAEEPIAQPQDGVPVELSLELEDATDAYDLSPENAQTRAAGNSKSAFEVQLMPATQTRATDAAEEALRKAKPTVLGSVVVIQKTSANKTTTATLTNVTLGTKVTLALLEDSNSELIIFVKGGGDAPTAGNWTTHEIKKSVVQSVVSASDIAKMPYLLHLKHVKIVKNTEGKFILQSVTGEDARLQLRRLAARLNVTWDYQVAGYELKEVTLQNYPTNYVAFPSETEAVYPSILSQFSTHVVTAGDLTANGFSCWMPRNVRGTVNITMPTLRGRQMAPKGSSYLCFVAVSTTNRNQKLMYYVYLGANATSDFNVRDNTNYTYHITFNHSNGEQVTETDARVEYLNGISASASNNSPVPTANCFMVEPGGSFNFDPFVFQTKANPSGSNALLKEWCKTNGICKVKLLWQTKEQGDIGAPVMGYANSNTDHSNIVDIKCVDGNGNVDETKNILDNPANDVDQCRIYCRVAAGTTGGSGLIAACDKDGKILWSWHVWVTDYRPDATGNASVLDDPNKRKLKLAASQLPMMDRNLGAMAGYVDFPPDATERFRTHGFHYQWGRKDPFASSYSNTNITTVNLPANATEPVEGLLNLYEADGVTYFPFSFVRNFANGYQQAYQNPQAIYKSTHAATSNYVYWLTSKPSDYRYVWGSTKTVHDPCPAGWRVSQWSEYSPLTSPKKTVTVKDGGMVLYYSNTEATYIRFTGYYYETSKFDFIGKDALLWSGTNTGETTGKSISHFRSTNGDYRYVKGGHEREAIPLRCIQESE